MFNASIDYLLVLAGQLEIVVLGVAVSGHKNKMLELVPEPFFRLATDNEHVTTIRDVNGRIVLGTKTGNVLEIAYASQKPSWFQFGQSAQSSKLKYAREIDHRLTARLINHTTWKLSVLLPTIIVNGLMLTGEIGL